MGNLRKNTDAVADLSGRVLSGAMFKLLDDMERVAERSVARVTVDIDDHADSARVVVHLFYIN